jgi:hypothetical protein
MIMLKKEYEIMQEFVKAPWERFTFNDVKKLSGKKSESYVYNSLKKFVKLGFLAEEKAGNVLLYRMNFESFKAQAYAGFVAEHTGWGKKHIPYASLQKIMVRIPYDSYVLLITGSYAKGKQNAKSDVDVVILIENSCEPERVYAELSQACRLSIPRIHLYVFRYSEFKEMLLNGEANYGKETAKNCLVLAGGQLYIRLIGKAIKNGFDGKHLS